MTLQRKHKILINHLFFADWLVFILNWLVFIEFLVVFSHLCSTNFKIDIVWNWSTLFFLVLFAVPSLYLDKKPINNRRRVAILYSRDGMPIRKELYLGMNTGFILRIRRLMTNRLSWMPSRLKIWWTGQSTRKCYQKRILVGLRFFVKFGGKFFISLFPS